LTIGRHYSSSVDRWHCDVFVALRDDHDNGCSTTAVVGNSSPETIPVSCVVTAGVVTSPIVNWSGTTALTILDSCLMVSAGVVTSCIVNWFSATLLIPNTKTSCTNCSIVQYTIFLLVRRRRFPLLWESHTLCPQRMSNRRLCYRLIPPQLYNIICSTVYLLHIMCMCGFELFHLQESNEVSTMIQDVPII